MLTYTKVIILILLNLNPILNVEYISMNLQGNRIDKAGGQNKILIIKLNRGGDVAYSYEQSSTAMVNLHRQVSRSNKLSKYLPLLNRLPFMKKIPIQINSGNNQKYDSGYGSYNYNREEAEILRLANRKYYKATPINEVQYQKRGWINRFDTYRFTRYDQRMFVKILRKLKQKDYLQLQFPQVLDLADELNGFLEITHRGELYRHRINEDGKLRLQTYGNYSNRNQSYLYR